MYKKISDFTDIINGYTFRGAIKPVEGGGIFILQARNITQGQSITNTDDLTEISFTGTRTASFLQKNDIIIVSRGMKAGSFRSAIFSSDNTNVIASSSLLIVRIKKREILPEYVSLYFNSSEGQNKIIDTVIGSYIGAISRRKFEEEVEIPIPSLEKQKSLIELDQNIKKQEQIYERKKQLKKQIVSATIKNLTYK